MSFGMYTITTTYCTWKNEDRINRFNNIWHPKHTCHNIYGSYSMSTRNICSSIIQREFNITVFNSISINSWLFRRFTFFVSTSSVLEKHKQALSRTVEVDVPTSSSPCTKLTILRVIDPGEIVSAGTVFGLFGFLLSWCFLILHENQQVISKISRCNHCN